MKTKKIYHQIIHLLFSILLIVLVTSISKQGFGQTTVTFTTSGNFHVPSGVTSVTVECWGSGGAGGGNGSTTGEGGGGGGGGYSKATGVIVIPDQDYAVTVGTGGSPTVNSGKGNASSAIGISANGGNGGTMGLPGSGGSGGTGDTYSGGSGANGVFFSHGGGGGGSAGTGQDGHSATNQTGASAVTDGGPGGNGTTSSNSNGSSPLSGPGGGGGGARRSSGSHYGGNGFDGQVKITYTVAACTAVANATCPGSSTVDAGGSCTYTQSGTGLDPTWTGDCTPITYSYVLTGATSGSASGTGSVSLDGVSFNKGATLVNWIAVDANAASATCNFTLTVQDNTIPVIAGCPSNQTLYSQSGNPSNCAQTGTWINPTASDNCTAVTLSYNLTGATTGAGTGNANLSFNIGITTVVYSAVDGAGLSASTCTFTVTVIDNTKPAISGCPSSQTVNTGPGNTACSQTASWSNGTATDNCTASTDLAWTYSQNPGTTFGVGTTTVTVTVKDAALNAETCTFDVVVVDNTIPVITGCVASQTVSTGPGRTSCDQVASWSDGTATDNCSVSTWLYSQNPGTAFAVGTTQVTVTVMDASDNSETCTFDVVVIDNTDPVLTNCPGDVTACAGLGNTSVSVTGLDPTASDNCPSYTVTYSLSGATSGTGVGGVSAGNVAFGIGNTTVAYTVTDAAGNSATCAPFSVHIDQFYQATVTQSIYDMCNPGLAIFAGNAPGSGTTSWNYTGQSTLPQNPPLSSPIVPNTLQVGNNLFFWNPVDGFTYTFDYVVTNGSCVSTAAVTFNDYPPAGPPNAGNPQTICEDATLTSFVLSAQTPTPSSATGTWSCLSAPSPLDPSTDVIFSSVSVTNPTVNITGNAALIPGVYTMAYAVYNGACGPYYSNVQVTIVAKPVITSNPSIPGGGPFCEGSTVAITGGAVSNSPLVSWSTPDGHGFFTNVNNVVTSYTSGIGDAGVGTVTLRLTVFGNSPCSAIIYDVPLTITANPTLICPSNLTVSCAIHSCDTSITVPTPTFNPNSSCVYTVVNDRTGTGDASDTYLKGVTTVKWTATFYNGNTATCYQTVTVVDDLAPVITGCPSDISVYSSTGNSTSCDQVASWTPPTAEDNCTVLSDIVATNSDNPGDAFTVGNHVITYTFKDLDNNISTCTFNVTVFDDTKPVISGCPSSQTLSTGPGRTSCDMEASWTEPGVSDNCNGVSMSSDYASGYAFPVGTTTVTYYAWDQNGNNETCQFDINVIDDTDPVISDCPGSQTLSTDGRTSCDQVATWVDPTVFDNCPGYSMTSDHSSGDAFAVGSTTVTFHAWDVHGNTADCSFTIDVSDNTPPVITACPGDMTFNTGPGATSCDQVATWTAPGVTDNCSLVTMTSDQNSGDVFTVGTAMVTYTAIDQYTNSATCTFNVTVVDNTDPLISCPADLTIDNDLGDCGAVVNFGSGGEVLDQQNIAAGIPFIDPPYSPDPVGFAQSFTTGQTGLLSKINYHLSNPGPDAGILVLYDGNGFLGTLLDIEPVTITPGAGDVAQTVIFTNPIPVISGSPYTFLVLHGLLQTPMVNSGVYLGGDYWQSLTQTPLPPNDLIFETYVTTAGGGVSATASDNCGAPTVVYNPPSGSFPVGTTMVTVTATDASTNSATCTFNVTVVDSEAPVISDCPSSQTFYTGDGHTSCDQVATWLEPSASDNCPGYSMTSDHSSNDVFGVGTTTVNYHSWDAHGNTADCSFDITVIDNTVPTIACPASSTVPADGSCQYTLGDYTGLATAWDNCGAPGNALAFDGIDDYVENNAMTIDPSLGFTIEGWMKVNDLTYSGLASQVVVNYPAPFDTYVVGTGDPDNAPGTVRFYLGQGVGPNLSHITTAATVTPGAWNHMAFVYDPGTTSMSIYLNGVLSATGPVVIPPANNGSSKFRIGGRDDMVTATNGTIDEVRIWNSVRTPAEIAANMNSTLQVLPPELKAYYKFDQGVANGSNPGVTTATDATGNYNGTLNNFALTGTSSNWVDGTVYLPNVTVTQSPAAATAIDKGLNTITLTATDVHGNSATCTFSLEVLDITDPAISNCPSSQTVYTGSGRTSCDMEATWTEPTASDNCPGFSMTADHASGDAFPVGTPTTVTYHAWDASGNTAADCSFTITVIDNTDPVITGCPSSQTISTFGLKSPVPQCGKIATWTAPTPSDNCPGVSMSSDHLSNDFFDVGTTTVTYHAWDAYGNTANCTFSITVVDNTPPVITGCPGDITVNTDAGRTSCDQNATWTAPTVSDNCPGVSMSSDYNSGDLFYLSGNPTTVTYHAWDAHGNTADCTFTVTVLDNTDPVITGCPSSQTVSTGPGRTSCDQVVSWTEPTVDDNCPGVSMSVSFSSGSLFPVGSTTVTYHAWDAHGNTANCTFDITVEDNTDPILSGCPSDMTLGTDTRTSCDQVATWVDPTYSDNCPGVSLSSDYASGSVFPVAGSPTTVTYTAYDAHGNFVTCQFNVTVQDNTPPVISNCPGNMTFNTGAGSTSCDAAVSWTAPTADDNCSTPTLTADMSPGTWIVGSYTVTYTAVDASTNSSTCSFTIDVIDNTPPTIGCPGDMTSCADDLQTYSTQLTGLGHASEGDNCGIATISYTLTGATSGSGTGDIADNSQFNNGITIVTYMATDIHGNSATCQFNITVFALPTPTWATSLTRQFTTSPVYTLTGGLPAGGTYSGNGVIPNTNSFKGVISGAGTQTLYYMVVDANTCSATVTNTIDVWDYITGDVTVGSGGDFWTITGMNGLFYSMNLLTCTGDVTAKIVSDIPEPGIYALTANYSPYNLNVVPVDANLRTMYGNYPSLGLFRLNGADKFTIDGNFGGSGRYLKWKSTAASAATFYLYNDARSNNIKNSIILGNNTSGTTSGVIYLGTTTGTLGNGLNVIDGNLIADTLGVPVNLIFSNGNNAHRNSDNTINNNELMNFKSNGIYVTATGNGDNWMITLNNFYTSLTTANTSQAAINFIPGASSANNNILGNTIGGMAIFAGGSPWQNAATGAYSGATWVAGYVKGISVNVGTSLSTVIDGNVIQNFKLTGQALSANQPPATFTGVEVLGGMVTVSGSTIGHASSAGSITVDGVGSFFGINQGSTNAGCLLDNNLIANVSYTLNTGTPSITGVYLKNGTVQRTAIYSIGTTLTTLRPTITGLQNAGTGGAVIAYYNNMVSLNAGSAKQASMFGFLDNNNNKVNNVPNGGTCKFWHNSINIYGGTSDLSTNTYDVYRGSGITDNFDMEENILSNTRTAVTGVTHYTIFNAVVGSFTSNYNDFYFPNVAGNPVTGYLLGYYNGANRSNLTAWQTATAMDANSMVQDPKFVSGTNLHLQSSSPCINAGGPALILTTDFDGGPRTIPPDMGADEYGAKDHIVVPALQAGTFDASLTIYPNPFSQTTTLACNVNEESTITLNVYDIMGQQVGGNATHGVSTVPAGTTTFDFSANDLKPGIYVCRMTINSGTASKVIVKRMEIIR